MGDSRRWRAHPDGDYFASRCIVQAKASRLLAATHDIANLRVGTHDPGSVEEQLAPGSIDEV